jgi:hypothetical protein
VIEVEKLGDVLLTFLISKSFDLKAVRPQQAKEKINFMFQLTNSNNLMS